MCFAGVGTTLLDIPSHILHSGVTVRSGIHPAGLRTLLAVPHLRILPLPSFLTVQVTLNFLLLSLMPAMKSKRQSQQQGARRDEGQHPWEEWAPHHQLRTAAPSIPRHCPQLTPGNAEEGATPQTLQQWWERTVLILIAPVVVSMDFWLPAPSRNRTKRETLFPGFQVHLEGQPKLAVR